MDNVLANLTLDADQTDAPGLALELTLIVMHYVVALLIIACVVALRLRQQRKGDEESDEYADTLSLSSSMVPRQNSSAKRVWQSI